MPKTTWTLALIASLGAAASLAAAEPPAAPPPAAATSPQAPAAAPAAPAPGEAAADDPVLGHRMVEAWKKELNLKPDQQATLDKMHHEFVGKFQPLFEQLRAKGKEIRAARHAETVDPELLKKLRTEMGAIGGRMRDLGLQFESDFASILDNEQKRGFEKSVAGFRLGIQRQMMPKVQEVTPTQAPPAQKVAIR